MPKVIFPEDTKVNSTCGVHCRFFPAKVPVDVPDDFMPAAIAAGGKSYAEGMEKTISTAPTAGDEDSIAEIVACMTEIVAENDNALLTSSGMPRASEVEKRLGRETTRAEREEAWAKVEV